MCGKLESAAESSILMHVEGFTKEFAAFVVDAEAAGFTLAPDSLDTNRLILRRLDGYKNTDYAVIRGWSRENKRGFSGAEPIGGAQTLDDFWSMKDLRRKFKIRATVKKKRQISRRNNPIKEVPMP